MHYIKSKIHLLKIKKKKKKPGFKLIIFTQSCIWAVVSVFDTYGTLDMCWKWMHGIYQKI